MKKMILALLVVLCLVCGIATAETAEVTELTWSQVEETLMSKLPGKIVEMDNYTFKYYLPDAFAKEDREGYEFYYTGDDYAYGAQAVEFPEDGLSAYYDSLKTDASFDYVMQANVNGYGAVIYRIPGDSPVACCSIEVEGGKLMTFYFGPVKDEDEFYGAVALFAGIQ
ncbi:MAG: hypothetical protein IJ088_16100 [Clostridia bacterium]|nr:hypothetical protein [Clostridia bacterium]